MKLIPVLCILMVAVACSPSLETSGNVSTNGSGPSPTDVSVSANSTVVANVTVDGDEGEELDDQDDNADDVDDEGTAEAADDEQDVEEDDDVSLDACPIVSAAQVQEACAIAALPNATIVDGHCVFNVGPHSLNVSSEGATKADFDDWMAVIETSDESGELTPYAGRAEMGGIKYFAWFTGAKLIKVTSNNVLICTGDHVDDVAAAVDLKATIGTTVDAWTGLKDHMVTDANVMALDNVGVAKLLSMSFDYAGDIAGESNATGEVQATFDDDQFSLWATLDDVPADTYKGWLVRKGGNISVISTGTFQATSDGYINAYASGTDLTDHLFFMVTADDVIVYQGYMER